VLTHVVAAVVGAAVLGGVYWVGGQRVRPVTPVAGPDPRTALPDAYAWTALPAAEFPIPPYAEHLAGVKIVLDPGHGGRGDRPKWKRGPTGLREAEVNLRVAQFLREFLLAVGAEVHMTREADVYLAADMSADLARRAALANALPADLFLSIHHNGADEPAANYTSMWYHGTGDHSPASRQAARWLLTALNEHLRLEQHLPCPLMSDTEMYESGFAVLRLADVPAVLGESCFHSNPEQEALLRDPVYNRREAYAYFLGLAQWAQAGLPRVRLATAGRVRGGQKVEVVLEDGLSRRSGWGGRVSKIVTSTIIVRLNGEPLGCEADLARGRLVVRLPRWLRAPAELYVDFENIFGQSVLHPVLTLPVGN
jgi:N-acetylmuramoyl-L-alanine amidase